MLQIWSADTAVLVTACRGHAGEVTDLSVAVDDSLVASSSNDSTVRCWSLMVSVLQHVQGGLPCRGVVYTEMEGAGGH